jgi:hypothetical protein
MILIELSAGRAFIWLDTREEGGGQSLGDPQAQEEARHGCVPAARQ